MLKKTSSFIIILIVIYSISIACIAIDIPYSQYTMVSGKGIRIAYKYDKANDLWIDFEKTSINNLMSISSFKLFPNKYSNTSKNLVGSANVFMKSCTDWVGPYIVRKNNGGNSNRPSFTGGWHNIKGKPTACTISYKVLCNGKTAGFDHITPNKYTEIIVTNLIKGYNTDNYILKETVHYSVRKGRITVENSILALDDITIERYYGIQTQNKSWRGKILYKSGDKVIAISNNMATNNPGPMSIHHNVNSFTLLSSQYGHRITAWIDRSNFNNVSNNQPGAFTFSYGKSYFNLVNGKEMLLSKNSIITWKGGYVIESK